MYGLTYRVGRHVPGLSRIFADVLHAAAGPLQQQSGRHRPQGDVDGWGGGGPGGQIGSLLLLGRPGLGKTTLLRQAGWVG